MPLGCGSQTSLIYLFILPLFNQVGKLRTSSHLQLRPGLNHVIQKLTVCLLVALTSMAYVANQKQANLALRTTGLVFWNLI